jgi:hypothetical protein
MNTPTRDKTDALVALADDLQEYADGCSASYLKQLAQRLRQLAAQAPAAVADDGDVDAALRVFHGENGNFHHVQWTEDQRRSMRAALATVARPAADSEAIPPKPFYAPGKWFPLNVLGGPMREFAPGKWESATWPSDTHPPAAATVPDEVAAEAMGAKGAPPNEAERAAFEAWIRGHCWRLSATWDGKQYRSDAEQGGRICPDAMRTRMLWAAWRDRAALAVPPAAATGFVLVPKVPTQAMLEAGVDAGVKASPDPWCPKTWSAMLAAAPPPPVVVDEGVEVLQDIWRDAAKLTGSALLSGDKHGRSDKERCREIATQILLAAGNAYHELTGRNPALTKQENPDG